MSILLRYGAARTAMFLLAVSLSPLVQAEEAQVVDLFTAIKEKQIKVSVFPQDSKRLTMKIENKTEKPLAIKLPDAMVAAPVHAQLLDNNNLFNEPNQNQNNGPQVVGMGQPNGNGMNQPGLNNMFGPQGNFRVPAARAMKLRLPCVCLQYGRREPSPRVPYEVRPIESFSTNPVLAEVLRLHASGEHRRRIAQIAVWHLSDKMSWSKLASLRISNPWDRSRQKFPKFSSLEIEAAEKLVEKAKKAAKSNPKRGSLALRN